MSIRERAATEMKQAGIEGDDAVVVSRILDIFFGQWDSGGAVSIMAPVLHSLICGNPLTPLTGENGEWEDRSEYEGLAPGSVFQNRRASSVFKRRYAPSDVTLADPATGDAFTYFDVNEPGDGHNGFKRIERFPYMPDPKVSDPVIVFGRGPEVEGK